MKNKKDIIQKNKEKNFISAVVYLHNNEKHIEEFFNLLNNVLEENFCKYEIIFVNDYSTDGTIEIIKKLSKKLNNTVVNIINLSYYQGVETSMILAIDLAIGDFVYEFDNILIDYDKEEIMNIYNQSLKGFDIVNAVPNKKINLISKNFYKIFNKYSQNQYKINTNSFRLISRRGINRVNSINKTIKYRKTVYANCGLKQYDYVYDINKRTTKRNYDPTKPELATTVLVLYTNIAYKASLFMSLLMALITVATVVYSIIIYLSKQPVAGWTTTILFMGISFFGIFVILSIILKYLAIIVNLIFKDQKGLFESIEKISK